MLLQLRGGSQAPVVVSKNFKFNDGIYLSHKEWQQNKPTLVWAEIETRLATVTTTLLTQIEFIKVRKTGVSIQPDSVWCVVLDGIPYIRLTELKTKKSATAFAGMILRGRLCYYKFDDVEEIKVPVTAYIPQTGQPYLTAMVPRKENVVREKVLVYETGAVYDLTPYHFRQLIGEDKELANSFDALKPDEITDKLFKVLLIFNDRNPVFLKNEK